jgi:N,N-dimethylformamidase
MSAVSEVSPSTEGGEGLAYAYFDRWTARPGERLSLYVSSETPFETTVVRVVQADAGPLGPGRKHELQEWYATSAHAAGVQSVAPGSWAVSGPMRMLAKAASVELEIIFRPSLFDGVTAQFVAGLSTATGDPALAIALDQRGWPELHVGAAGSVRRAGAPGAGPLRVGRWYQARAALDLERASVELSVLSVEPAPCGDQRFDLRAELSSAELSHLTGAGSPNHLVLAAARESGSVAGGDAPTGSTALGSFNGKLEAPVVSGWSGESGTERRHFRYAWRLVQGARTSELIDSSDEHVVLRLVNAPTAAVTGHNFDGRVLDFTKAPDHYDALGFHDDDLEDAGWGPSLEIELPSSLRSGVYAVVVSNASGSRHVPFFVVPAPTQRRAKIAVLMPSFTYLAYANEHVREEVGHFEGVPSVPSPQDLEMAAHREFGLSLYDHHSDGTGVCYSSTRRPVINFDPTYRFWLFDGPVHLGEDIYLIDWLERLGYAYDVLTDHELDAEGPRVLEEYRVVITGSHPEYVSLNILNALEGHVRLGGRLMYLGGNGHYWVTSVDPRRPYLIEIRRGNSGGRTWESAPGEGYHSTTGEPGGLWRHRGRPPNRLFGVGFSAQGADVPAPGYKKVLEGSLDNEWGFVFEGVEDPDSIGEFGLLLGGAAGNEIDRADQSRGTPLETVVLATSKGHSDAYQLGVEDILLGAPGQGGTEQPMVRSDMVMVPHASGGRVFSVGAITWLGSLAYNDYDNDVAKIMRNVLDYFVSQ